MGVEDYLLTSTVIGILAQRLVRTLCPHCQEEYVALPELVEEMGLRKFADGGEIRLFHEKGCRECAQTGYIGRISIMEMLPMTDPLRSLIMRHATSTDLRAEAIKGGMTTMYEDGMRSAQGSRPSKRFFALPARIDGTSWLAPSDRCPFTDTRR